MPIDKQNRHFPSYQGLHSINSIAGECSTSGFIVSVNNQYLPIIYILIFNLLGRAELFEYEIASIIYKEIFV